MFRKNKVRKHYCTVCGHKELNRYYGIKSYDEIPLYLIDLYELHQKECAWCRNTYFYLIKKGV